MPTGAGETRSELSANEAKLPCCEFTASMYFRCASEVIEGSIQGREGEWGLDLVEEVGVVVMQAGTMPSQICPLSASS